MHPTTARYLAASFAHDREAEAARDRRLAEFRRGQAGDAGTAEPRRRSIPGAGIWRLFARPSGAAGALGAPRPGEGAARS